MIPTVLSLFGLVIGSFLNAVIHRVTLRMRNVTMGACSRLFWGP
jgi:prepilin signal peptidase PulO-like enzyme (type II secretory pathway)